MKPSARILVVEDEGIVAMDIAHQLTKLGYDPVAITGTAEEALELSASLRPQLVLMDIHLAGEMDGIEAAALLRERFAIPCIFLTAYATDEVVERAKRAEPLGYIIKPFDEYALRTSIEIALHKDRSDRLLRESQARYRAIVRASADAIVSINHSGLIIGWSPGAERMFGYSEGVALGGPSTLFLPSAAGPAAAQLAEAFWSAESPSINGDLRARRSDGAEFPIERSLAHWETTEGWCTTAFVRDITYRVQFEKSMRLQAAALRAAANAIVITDRSGTIQWVNPAFTALTGYSSSDAVGRNPRDLVRSGEHADEFYEEMWDTIIAGRVWEGEVTNRRKDGTVYRELQTITPVTNAAGEISNFVAIKRDLTHEKRLQEQFLQAQKMEVVGRLAGGIAHDFNNLLTVINGESDLALSDLRDGDPMREPLQAILDAGQRAARLTAQLLAFSRKQIATPSILSVSAQINGLAPMIRRLIGEDIVLSLDIGAPHDQVRIDRGQFEQVILNLAVNARDAMPAGGTLRISVRSSSEGVRVAITDTGVGIPDEIRHRLFEPFFTTKAQGKGTGLGLATVYAIVAQCGGSLEVESVVGRGTTFTVLLPVSTLEVMAEAAPTAASSGHETVVLVEDERDVREITARMLRSAGYAVLPMESSAAALAWFEHTDKPIDLMISDVVMPGLTGPELAAAVRAIRPDLRVLFSSGYADDRLTAEVLTDPEKFIAKPYHASTLTAKVRRLLDAQPVG